MDSQAESVVAGAAAASSSRVVLFDFDGVLMRGDAFTRFVRSRFRRSWWRSLLVLILLPLLLPLFAIRPLRISIIGIFVRISLLGVDQAQFNALVREFATELVGRPRIFIRQGISAMRRHLVDGDRVIVVTGCEDTLVRAIFDAIGLPDIEIVASHLRKGRLGMCKKIHNFGPAKPGQIALYGINEPWDLAYSDSAHDIPMLKRAREAVLVNADARTSLRVRRALGHEVRGVYWF
ncbi:MAG TPA: haloacid dehalogenase-like hydrolase [Dokdonella sp.]|uniref:haloacid dehalogenase-like hydrolase n=1 Tax=Dokdonella sp. TaxID=2291710 RepID=UPI002D7E5AF0|nr:haloacid dehalogenase-like hydrolase [Dokdonella sp.]HET9033123.1 haloacid dehalogenase-like hydrolase [Dokdonella sp.]